MTFTLGGFVQTVGRLARSNIRPLFLPSTYVVSRTSPPPPQTPLKIAYDIAGTMYSPLILNYVAAPFMLLTWKDSMLAWSRLGWYGHWITFGPLAFFYLGGSKLLKGAQMKRVKKAGVKVDKDVKVEVNGNGSTKTPVNGSGAATPRVQTLPPFDDVAKEVENSEFMRKFN